uniref:Uncharacterized protein n=1 Tax=Lepeophtheirus salmonis TaxID=72036 RepID=A0A0K2UXH2_LEPSM
MSLTLLTDKHDLILVVFIIL